MPVPRPAVLYSAQSNAAATANPDAALLAPAIPATFHKRHKQTFLPGLAARSAVNRTKQPRGSPDAPA
jgi:hypothetical protein